VNQLVGLIGGATGEKKGKIEIINKAGRRAVPKNKMVASLVVS